MVNCFPQSCSSKGYRVSFPNQYRKMPSVTVSIADIDADSNAALPVRLSAIRIITSSFVIDFGTLTTSKIYWLKFVWIACT